MKLWFLLLLLILNGVPAWADGPVTVGIEGRLEITLPFAGLQAVAPKREAPINVRIAASKTEGTATLYDLRYIGLVPGHHDLRAYLLNPDGAPAADLPPMVVEIAGILPASENTTWIEIPKDSFAIIGGYRWALGIAAGLWLLAAIPFLRRRREPAPVAAPVAPPPLTLPERLRPLVEQAAAGQLSVAGKAELERMVLGHWSESLGLAQVHPSAALPQLRAHPQAGVLLRALEDWLHRRPGSAPIDLEPLLAAYASAPAETPAPVAP